MNKVHKDEMIKLAQQTGIEVVEENGVLSWRGKYGGRVKPNGPLKGKRIGILIASEFSDFQAYHLASYIGEYGGICEFIMMDWVIYKFVRPNIANKGVRGMWDLSVDPIPVMGTNKNADWKNLKDAKGGDYDAVVVLGGHSADVLVTEKEVTAFLKEAAEAGAVVSAIASGSIPLIAAGLLHGKRCTGDRTVDFMMRRIGTFVAEGVVTDGKIITARTTTETPWFFRALCAALDPGFQDPREGSLKGKSVLFPLGEDFEDIELVVPTMEFLYRGAEVIIGRFEPELRARPPLLGMDNVSVGNFGVTVPFQEIPDSYYTIKPLDDVKMSEFDVVFISGAFNPWNMVATGTSDWLKAPYSAGKGIAAICHGTIPVAAADLIHGKHVTGWLASRDAVEIMGGIFHSEQWAAAIDGNMITGRTPPEIPEFLDAIAVWLLTDK